MTYSTAHIDLDQPTPPTEEPSPHEVAECSCGVRRSTLRHFAVSPCAGRALARLKAAHADEYAQYLGELKDEALAEFEARWHRHLAGDHH